MNILKHRHGAFLALLVFVLFVHIGPVYSQNDVPLIGFQAPDSGMAAAVVLYFRYADSGMLGQEARNITIPHTQRMEMSLVQALLDGPAGTSAYLRRLFPPSAEVLSVLEEGDQLFVTFNEGLMAAMQGDDLPAGNEGTQAIIRRRLMMASLVNTLTETGQYKSVQVLMMSPSGISTSMRLSARIFLEDNNSPLPPFTRQEDAIVTAGKAADFAMGFWQQQRWDELQRYTISSQQSAGLIGSELDFPLLPALLSWQVSDGSYSPDGTYAIVTLSAQVMDKEGLVHELALYPLRMDRQDGVWKLNDASLRLIMEGST
jgi:hypothetical protein